MTEQDYRKLLKNKLIEYRTSLCLPGDLTFGIEIEYENIVKDTMSYLLDYEQIDGKLIGWKNTNEIDIMGYNSLGEEMNGEINSPILTDNIDAWRDLKLVLDILKNNNAVISEKCGGHVNIGSHIFENNIKYIRNFILLWKLYEKEIYKFCSGNYKKLRIDKDKLFKSFASELNLVKVIGIKNIRSINRIPNVLSDKFHDIYIHKPIENKINYKNVIEFRVPNGSLNEEIWQNYINFFAKFILVCKKDIDIEKVIYKISKDDHNLIELVDLVFTDDIDKQNFLIQTLKINKVYQKFLPEHKIYY